MVVNFLLAGVAGVACNEAGTHSFLVEWYGPRAPARWIGETAQRLNDRAAAISARGEQVRLLMAVAVPSDDYAFGVFAAVSAEAVAETCADADAPPGTDQRRRRLVVGAVFSIAG
jgi:hypothetical protein